MKTRMNLAGLVLVLALLALLSSSHKASAYYDPGVQRWVSRDPDQERGGLNLYCFVLNNPIAGFDPLGFGPCSAEQIAECEANATARGLEFAGCSSWSIPIPCYGTITIKHCKFKEPPPKLKKCYYACPNSNPVYTEQFPGQFSGGCPKVRAPDRNGQLVDCLALGPF